jgi:hypothetical protein
MRQCAVSFEPLGFRHDYSIELDPEFPGDGEWDCQAVGFSAEGEPLGFLESPWGIPLVLRVIPQAGNDWVLSISGGNGLTSLRGIYATPQPDVFLAVVDGAGLFVRATDPSSAWPLGVMVTQVYGSALPRPVLLISRGISLVAMDADGILWQTPRLCWDDLTIERIEGNEVHCSGDFLPPAPFVLDLSTGERLSGPAFIDPTRPASNAGNGSCS